MTKRIEFIDSMRGFTMLLVVYSHVVQWCCCIEGFSFNNIFILLRMPLFFFVSGFLVEKCVDTWPLLQAYNFIVKKAKVQLLSTSIFLVAFCVLTHTSLLQSVMLSTKSGFWFTLVLFVFFTIYTIGKVLPRNLQIVYYILMSLVALCAKTVCQIDEVADPLSISQWWYYVFFMGGVFFKRHYKCVLMLIDSHYIIIPLALFPICAIVSVFQIFEVNSIISLMMRVIAGVSGVVIVFAFFWRYEDAFTKERKLGRILQYVGRRTLDVYLLHYFILPHNMNYLGDFFANNPNPQLEFIVSISIAAYVVALCLIVSNIIRLSDILSNILFGVNSKPNSSEISK